MDEEFSWAGCNASSTVCARGGPKGTVCMRNQVCDSFGVTYIGTLIPAPAARASGWSTLQAFVQRVEKRNQYVLYGFDEHSNPIQMVRARALASSEPSNGESVVEEVSRAEFRLSRPYLLNSTASTIPTF